MIKKTKNDTNLKELDSLGRAILNSSPEGILLADKSGKILYTNESYNEICKTFGNKRLGENIFETNPNGALSETLKTGKSVFGKRHRPPKSNTNVVANSYPLYHEGDLIGGIVFFREEEDIIDLLEQLKNAKESLSKISSKLDNLGKACHTFDSIIGRNKLFTEVIDIAKKVATTDTTVLLKGETGTGKELFASAIHNESCRNNKPFIHVNCASIPDSLLESEFFGYEKGSFTGAGRRKIGTFELADGGTIFLDEIGELDIKLQSKLLQVLQSGEFRMIGGSTLVKVNARVIAATNRDLLKLVEEEKFRPDLFFRLNVVEINIPSLRERKSDIPLLANSLLRKHARKIGREKMSLTKDALKALEGYDWPGNVRELENVIERAIILNDGFQITSKDLLIPDKNMFQPKNFGSIKEMEYVLVMNALNEYGTSLKGKKKAAETLGISLTTLYNIIKKGAFDK